MEIYWKIQKNEEWYFINYLESKKKIYSNLPPFLSIKAFLSLSKCNLVITTLDGWMLIGTEAPLDFSLEILSTWIANFNL